MFTPLKIIDSSGNLIWKEESPCSPHSSRPLMLFLGKESLQNMPVVMEIHKERKQIENFCMKVDNSVFDIEIDGSFTMIDGKMRKAVTGLGGAWCMLCTCTRQEASGQTPEGLERVKAGFQINRSLQQTHNIYEEMNVSGRMIGSSQSRLGVTQQPLLNEEHMVLMVSPLHALLRTFDFVLKLLVLLRANIDVWTENKKQLGERFESFKRAKNEVIAHVKEKTNITIEVPDSTGKGGTSTTGNAVHALMASDTNRKMLSSLVKDMEELLLRLWVISKI